jgi:hypothetical protein
MLLKGILPFCDIQKSYKFRCLCVAIPKVDIIISDLEKGIYDNRSESFSSSHLFPGSQNPGSLSRKALDRLPEL